MAGEIVNVGIIGYGKSAKTFHIPFITVDPQLKLHSIVQRKPSQDNSAIKDHPEAKHYTDYKDLLADPEVHLVVLTTPPDSHFELSKAVLEAGKNVLTEKPFVPTVAEAEKLIAIAKENNKLICVYQNRRWDHDFLTVKHLVSQGTLGRIVEFNTHFDRFRPEAPTNWTGTLGISSGGSALFDLGTHLIDQVYTLFGMPSSVHGRMVSQRQGKMDYDTPDSIYAELTYPNGMLVYIRIGVLCVETSQPRFCIRGSKGTFRKYGLDIQEDQLKAGMRPDAAEYGQEAEDCMRLVLASDHGKIEESKTPIVEAATYKTFYAALAKAVVSGKEEDVPVKATEVRDVLRVIEGVVESAKTGKDVTF